MLAYKYRLLPAEKGTEICTGTISPRIAQQPLEKQALLEGY